MDAYSITVLVQCIVIIAFAAIIVALAVLYFKERRNAKEETTVAETDEGVVEEDAWDEVADEEPVNKEKEVAESVEEKGSKSEAIKVAEANEVSGEHVDDENAESSKDEKQVNDEGVSNLNEEQSQETDAQPIEESNEEGDK